jgi:prephenate dehydrogenase
VVFATPVETFAPLAKTVSGFLKHGALVIDVGSVKSIVYDMEGLMPPGIDFVGCHPIAGSERSGVEASSPGLFEGALCIITRTPGTAVGGVEKAAGLWREVGSVVEFLRPEEHDIIYGLVSHFPHLVAYAIVNTASDADSGCLRFAGPGFMDTTRIALGSPELWSNICLMNRDNLLRFIDVFKENLDSLGLCLKGGDREGLQRAFQKARQLREDIGD